MCKVCDHPQADEINRLLVEFQQRDKRICPFCGQMQANVKAANSHMRHCPRRDGQASPTFENIARRFGLSRGILRHHLTYHLNTEKPSQDAGGIGTPARLIWNGHGEEAYRKRMREIGHALFEEGDKASDGH